MRALLRWQRDLRGWPKLTKAPDATPFVSVYSAGRLRGCIGCDEGEPAERLARGFLRALEDHRFGGVLAGDREELAAQVAYPAAARAVSVARLERTLEPGTHGLAYLPRGGTPTLLLPQVARDERFEAAQMIEALALKAGVERADLRRGTVFTFETDALSVRADERPSEKRRAAPSPVIAAGEWLASRVDGSGRVAFAVDARTREVFPVGEFHHGRAAIVIQALAATKRHARRVARAKRWLRREIERALAGHAVDGWPRETPRVAGTVALAALAGVEVTRELRELSAAPGVTSSAWHAAQVVAALGPSSPEGLWKACVADLAAQPWAPWTAIAARRIDDAAVLARCHRALAGSIKKRGPYEGGTDVTPLPELALTAVVVEALAGAKSKASTAAAGRARDFLLQWQLAPGAVPASLDADLAAGAFPLSPVLDGLRADVTAHAVLALLAR